MRIGVGLSVRCGRREGRAYVNWSSGTERIARLLRPNAGGKDDVTQR